MSYEGGGAQGPAGATGATGATGAVDFSGPSNSILWYDGSGITGTSDFKWYNGEIYGYTIYGGPSENTIMLDDNTGSMRINIAQVDEGKSLLLSAGNTTITLTDAITGEIGATGTLEIVINGDAGITGQYLGSDGAGKITWSTPPGFVYAGITPDLTDVTWNTGDYGTYTYDYAIPGVTLYSNANVQVTTINGSIDVAQACWLITTIPNPSGGIGGSLRFVVASNPVTTGTYYLSILVLSVGTP
jgi:hypothetical protein